MNTPMPTDPTEPTISLVLTVAEASALRQLLHFATQARGLDVAEAALHFTKKLEEAVGVLQQAQNNPVGRAGNGTDRRVE